MTTTIGLLVAFLVCLTFFIAGFFCWFYPIQTTVYGYKLYLLLSFPYPGRERAIQNAEEMLGVQLRENPIEGYRQYFDTHPEVKVRYKSIAIIFWFGPSVIACNVLNAIIQGKVSIF